MIEIAPLADSDRAAWQALATGYNDFYGTVWPPEVYDRVWGRLRACKAVHALAARLDGGLISIAHYLFHSNVWRDDVCYLQDLFVDETVRGQGAARALIDAVAAEARRRDASRYYWQTRQDNAGARALYDKVAVFCGFIRYDHPLD